MLLVFGGYLVLSHLLLMNRGKYQGELRDRVGGQKGWVVRGRTTPMEEVNGTKQWAMPLQLVQ